MHTSRNNGITGIKVSDAQRNLETTDDHCFLTLISHSEHVCVLYIPYIFLCICAF